MSPLRKDAVLAAAATIAATAAGLLIDGPTLAAATGVGGALAAAVAVLWRETHRLRRAQATRANRIGKRIGDLERRTGELTDLLSEHRRDSTDRLDAVRAETLTTLTDGLKQILAANADDAQRRSRELAELRTDHLEPLAARTESLTEAVDEFALTHKRITKDQNRILFAKIDDLVALYRDIDADGALPALHGWAAGPDLARTLYNEVVDGGRNRVLECGSGSTTVILAYALRSVGSGHVTALEHDPGYAEATRRQLHERGLSEWASVVDAPLVDIELDGTTLRWYDPAARPPGPIDLLLVDGPPGASAPQARYPALPMLADRLADDAVVVLDDAYRKDERNIGKRWTTEFDGWESKVLKSDFGTLVLRRSATAA